ncbi:hypothetical protein [Candidatus Halobonum tyrrellensis]|uniref:hypothetical protein n=1 Tax=Candidatus Halobonum tyrrellensis TaxID=1431545 RepID=UPI000677806B|nr:hypothetical protein [Candidatus Halobonum tyrrellensis]
MSRPRPASLLVAAATLALAVAGPSAVAHPGHAAHDSGAAVGWFAPLAVCAGAAVGVGAVGLRTEGVVSGRAAAVGGAAGALCLAAGVGAFAGLL